MISIDEYKVNANQGKGYNVMLMIGCQLQRSAIDPVRPPGRPYSNNQPPSTTQLCPVDVRLTSLR